MTNKKMLKIAEARREAWEAYTKAKKAAMASSLAWENARRTHYFDLIDAALKVGVVKIESDSRTYFDMSSQWPRSDGRDVVTQRAFCGTVTKTHRGSKHFGIWFTNAEGKQQFQTLNDLSYGKQCRIVGIAYPSAKREDYQVTS